MKLESLKSSKFEALSKSQTSRVLGGGAKQNTSASTSSVFAGKGWCEKPTPAGGRPDLGVTWSSDTEYTDGNGKRVGLDTKK